MPSGAAAMKHCMPTAAALWLALVPLVAQADAAVIGKALADYRAGRYPDAFAALQAECSRLGDAAPAELRFDLALAALRVQRSGDAEDAVRGWLVEPSGPRRADAEFITALAAFQRAERAALAAQLPDAEPTAWTMAVQAMERAAACFQRAEAARAGWPEAQRNRARAEVRLRELQAARDRAAAKAKQEQAPKELPAPKPDPGKAEEAVPELEVATLPPHEVAALLQRLQQKDLKKRTLRQEAQRRAVTGGARAW
ncbi:MAG: hypothetical protein JNK15_10185 [Planctomycetes bacterium]|nr:hypothetical protein [Planctomycetota bacterium]